MTWRNSIPTHTIEGRLFRIEDMKVEAATLAYHHNMGNTSDMRPGMAIVFHVRLLIGICAYSD